METTIWQQFRRDNVAVYGISNESLPTIEQFVKDQGVSFPVLQDNAGVYGRYSIGGGISPYPRDFIIDQEGVLRYTSTEYEPQTMIGVIRSLIGYTRVDTTVPSPLPETVDLAQNYPNPFNATTTIRFGLHGEQYITLDVLNLRGKRIARLAGGKFPAGWHAVQWNGRDIHDTPVASGMYIYRLQTTRHVLHKRMIVLQ